MRFMLLLIMSVQGDMQSTQVGFSDHNLCNAARRQIEETMARAEGITLHGAYCLEVRY